MREQLLLLIELQKIDSSVHELLEEMESLPQALAPMQRDLQKLEKILQGEKAQLEETETWVKEQEDQVKREQEALISAKGKLQASRNAKDYGAASREIDNKRRAISQREEEVLKVFDALEKSKANIAAHEEGIQQLRDEVESKQEAAKTRILELKQEVEARTTGRDEVVAKIDQALLKRYDRVRRAKGSGIVGALDGACQGCYMSLPPQLYNHLARMESVESCPRCVRLIYRVDAVETLDDNAATDSGETAGEEPKQETSDTTTAPTPEENTKDFPAPAQS